MTAVDVGLTAADVQAIRAGEVPKIWFAPDGLSTEHAVVLTSELARWIVGVKIHSQYDADGPNAVRLLKRAGARRVWVDYKLDDVPRAVALRARPLAQNGADVITVHAGGGIEMMRAAIDAVSDCGSGLTEIWAITLLTSLDRKEIARDFGKYGKKPTAWQIVRNRALMAREAGVRTIVCSAKEVRLFRRREYLADVKLAVPGTRSVGVNAGSQKRSGTPSRAAADGANHLIVASQVTEAANPIAAFKTFAIEAGMQF